MSSDRELPGRPAAAPSDADRRRDTRAPIELKVEYKRLNSFLADYTRNISKDGTFIGTTKPLPIGTAFVFRLAIPGLDQPLELRGRVSWLVQESQAGPDRPPGMGIAFQYTDETERRDVHRIVEDLMRRSLGEDIARRVLDKSASLVPTGGPRDSDSSSGG